MAGDRDCRAVARKVSAVRDQVWGAGGVGPETREHVRWAKHHGPGATVICRVQLLAWCTRWSSRKSGSGCGEDQGERGDTSEAQLGKWGPLFNQGVDRMRRLVCEYYEGFSFGAFVRRYPELQGTITDLLIGDLFTDRVDKVWEPMKSLYPAGKKPIPPWNAGTPQDEAPEKANELVMPDGRRP